MKLEVGCRARDRGDLAAIEACVRDYFEGWFDGDAARMERALHPELAKRSFSARRSTGRRCSIPPAQPE